MIIEICHLLRSIDEVLANAAERMKKDKRLQDVADYALTQKKLLLIRTLELMKEQGMTEELSALIGSEREFMRMQEMDPRPWTPKEIKKEGGQ